MICKDSFVKIMDSLQDYWGELGKDMDRLGVVFENNHLTRVFDNIMDALCDDLEADFERDEYETPWCYYFALNSTGAVLNGPRIVCELTTWCIRCATQDSCMIF